MKDNSKKFSDWVKSLTEEDYANMGKELEKKWQINLAFYNSPRFSDVLNQVKLELKIKPVIHDDPYPETLFGNVSNTEFNQIFSCLFDETISGLKPKISDQEADMYNEEFRVFDGLRFRMISGQGIGLSVSLV